MNAEGGGLALVLSPLRKYYYGYFLFYIIFFCLSFPLSVYYYGAMQNSNPNPTDPETNQNVSPAVPYSSPQSSRTPLSLKQRRKRR